MANNVEELNMEQTPVRRKISVLITVLLILAVLLCLYIVLQALTQGYVNIFGFSLFRVVTGSMEPTLSVGTLLVSKEVEMAAVDVGDIICFRAQESAIFGKMMTHRVTEIMETADGALMFVTKGDANLTVDGYYVTAANLVGKVIWYSGASSLLSKIFSFFTNKVGFLACIVFPSLCIAGLILRDCVTNIRKELQQVMDELESEPEAVQDAALNPEEYHAMYERIRKELLEELSARADETTESENAGSEHQLGEAQTASE